MSTTIVQSRLQWLEKNSLSSGNHSNIKHGCCVMEAVAYVAGEPHSDHPQCACPIITSFMISWNDNLPSNAERDRLLKPLVPQLVGTRASKAVEQIRGCMCVDWTVRVFLATWLDLAPSLKVHAEALRKSPEITSDELLLAITPVLTDIAKQSAAARDAAWAAARDAAWDAARDAAWAAARDVARVAVWDAAWAAARVAACAAARDAAWAAARDVAWAAAWDAVWDVAWAAVWDVAWAAVWDAAWAAARAAVWDAARDAVWDAAWAAARAAVWDAARDAARDVARVALNPTVDVLQTSATELVHRMISVK